MIDYEFANIGGIVPHKAASCYIIFTLNDSGIQRRMRPTESVLVIGEKRNAHRFWWEI
jgi:hypothetical protein